jgi:hypothetical protein
VTPHPAHLKVANAPALGALGLSPERPLVVVDVDEVLGLFMAGFGGYLAAQHGLELRVERFALFENIFRPGGAEPVERAQGQALFDAFFRTHCGEIEPTPGAIPALERLRRHAEIVVLSNAPREAEALRRAWLRKHGLAYPLVLNTGPKGPITAGLVAQCRGRSAFVDDLLPNLDSVAEHAPATTTFQHVADPRLRPLAPCSARHRRIDDWTELGLALEQAVAG